jgi:hypothetical protein
MEERKTQLQKQIDDNLYSSYKWTLLGLVLSVPASKQMAYKHRFAPLLILGGVGIVADIFEGLKAAEPFKRELDHLNSSGAQAEQSEA